MNKTHFTVGTGVISFGDAITVLLALSNLCIKNTCTCSISAPPVFKELLDVFDFSKTTYLGAGGRENVDVRIGMNYVKSVGDYMYDRKETCDTTVSIQFAQQVAKEIGVECFEKVIFPKCKVVADKHIPNQILCQFDAALTSNKRKIEKLFPGYKSNRGSHDYNLTLDQMKLVLKTFTTDADKIAAIGGPNTKKYLGDDFEYRIGDVAYLTKELLGCKMFIGSDSGMSHLAGILGVSAKIVILSSFVCAKVWYQIYENSEFFSAEDFRCKTII